MNEVNVSLIAKNQISFYLTKKNIWFLSYAKLSIAKLC